MNNIQQSLLKATVIILIVCCAIGIHAQGKKENIPTSTLSERSWWNLLHYSINIRPDYDNKFISGSNTISFIALHPGEVMRIDLLSPMKITSAKWQNKTLKIDRIQDASLIHFPRTIHISEKVIIIVQFEGKPTEAVKPPWGQSGWIWTTDKLERPWYSLACEGSGAAIWLPCKNGLYDEPDSGLDFTITVPDTLVAVANGRLAKITKNDDHTASFRWIVVNPINNYDICPSVGKYVSWHHDYKGLKGKLDCDYWVLDYNRQKAEQHLKAVDSLLFCFEKWMGPYPFYEDSYKVIESPMAGMEHQSGIAYGNGFTDGYGGKNISGTVWSNRWDFVLVHESGHEWFGNSITSSAYVDGWIHEGFTKYLEVIYTGEWFGDAAGNEYAIGISKRIKNDQPVLGGNTSDQYYKASAMLHMIRQITGDEMFKKILHDLNRNLYHSTVTTTQVLGCMYKTSARDFSSLFKQYLETTQIPILEYYFDSVGLHYRWSNCVAGFDIPIKINVGEHKNFFISPVTTWKRFAVEKSSPMTLAVDPAFYVQAKEYR